MVSTVRATGITKHWKSHNVDVPSTRRNDRRTTVVLVHCSFTGRRLLDWARKKIMDTGCPQSWPGTRNTPADAATRTCELRVACTQGGEGAILRPKDALCHCPHHGVKLRLRSQHLHQIVVRHRVQLATRPTHPRGWLSALGVWEGGGARPALYPRHLQVPEVLGESNHMNRNKTERSISWRAWDVGARRRRNWTSNANPKRLCHT